MILPAVLSQKFNFFFGYFDGFFRHLTVFPMMHTTDLARTVVTITETKQKNSIRKSFRKK